MRKILIALMFVVSSCEKFIDVELTNSRVTTSVVFSDDNTATAAMIGVYYDISTSVINTGATNSVSRLAGLSADELIDYQDGEYTSEFQNNSINSDNPNVAALWNAYFKIIFDVNAIIEGLGSSSGMSDSVRNQIHGEALFVRAFCNFYLVNFFGAIPLITETDYRKNSSVSRQDQSVVYSQIVVDLIEAEQLLGQNYVTVERVRPNAAAASALLAKVYLFLEDWAAAETAASKVINNPTYQLVMDFDQIFLKESPEAIWQVAPTDDLSNTDEATFYVIVGSPSLLVIRDSFVNHFEQNDARLVNWIGSVIVESDTVYYPNKYKLRSEFPPAIEYSSVIRLAEMYLIRSESRLKMGQFDLAVEDLDVIRARAGLLSVDETYPSIDAEHLANLLETERALELFTEWGNRWFDLNRTGRALEVLDEIKPGFNSDDMLYPIPESERQRNTMLGNQNPGY